jgi:cell division protein FtsA
VAVLGEAGGQTIQRRKLCEIIEARMGEIYSLIREEVKRSGHAGMLPAGAVLTGGGARLAGADVLARDTLEMPVRIGSPQGVGGLMDQIGNPAFSTSIGLLLWGAHHLGDEPIGYAAGNGVNPISRVGEWIRNLFPG